MTDSIINFQNVRKTYDGDLWVIKDMNLSINRGEFVTLLGPSGSGKTTLLMMLAGFESVTEGEITLNGKTINQIPPHKRNLGVVFQDYALFPHMNVYHNIAFPLKIRRQPSKEINHKVESILEMVNMIDFKEKPINELSGGQKQRIALARSLVFEPPILLLDEPLCALDRKLRDKMQFELRTLQKKLNITFIYVTHDQKEALVMSDKVAVLNDGILQQYDVSQKLYKQPENKFVASFFGENNIIDYKVSRSNGKITLQTDFAPAFNIDPTRFQSHIQRSCLSVRPEHIRLSAEKTQDDFSLQAIIQQVFFMGDYYRIQLVINQQFDMIANLDDLPPKSEMQIQSNEPIFVNWQLSDCAFF